MFEGEDIEERLVPRREKMKILYLMEYLPGGGQLSTWTLCDGLVKEGSFEPVVACPKLLNKKEDDFSFRVVEYRSDENRERNKASRIWKAGIINTRSRSWAGMPEKPRFMPM